MVSRQDVEKFLISKYGTEIFKYKGFRYVRDLIMNNNDYITGNIIQEYTIVAATYDKTDKSVERAIRTIKEATGHKKDPNGVFINNLIFEFKEYKKGEL